MLAVIRCGRHKHAESTEYGQELVCRREELPWSSLLLVPQGENMDSEGLLSGDADNGHNVPSSSDIDVLWP